MSISARQPNSRISNTSTPTFTSPAGDATVTNGRLGHRNFNPNKGSDLLILAKKTPTNTTSKRPKTVAWSEQLQRALTCHSTFGSGAWMLKNGGNRELKLEKTSRQWLLPPPEPRNSERMRKAQNAMRWTPSSKHCNATWTMPVAASCWILNPRVRINVPDQ